MRLTATMLVGVVLLLGAGACSDPYKEPLPEISQASANGSFQGALRRLPPAERTLVTDYMFRTTSGDANRARTVGEAIVLQRFFVSHAPPPPPPSARAPQAAPSPPTNPSRAATGKLRSVTISVEVDATKSNGKAWDAAGGAPDVALCVTTSGGTICAPDGASIGGVTRPQCRDAFQCAFTMEDAGDDFRIDVVDVDLAVNDPIGSGSCRRGATCRLGQAVVTVR